MRAEKRLPAARVINQVMKVRVQEIYEQQGYKRSRKQMREIKGRVTDELPIKALMTLSAYCDTCVWIDPANRWLVINAGAVAPADEVRGLLAKTIDPFTAEGL